jgi:hypothetical protein
MVICVLDCELPKGFADAVRAWLLVLLDGDTRAGPARPPASMSTSRPSGRLSSIQDRQICVVNVGSSTAADVAPNEAVHG